MFVLPSHFIITRFETSNVVLDSFPLMFPSLYDSLNLKNLGLSDACLATLASEGEAPTFFLQC